MMCVYVDFECDSVYDGVYELDAVISSETQIFYHQTVSNAVLYFDHGEWSLNHPNEYRWYTTVEEIFGTETGVNWFETDEVLSQLATYSDCVSNLLFF